MAQTLLESKKAKIAASTITGILGLIVAQKVNPEAGVACMALIACVYTIWQAKVDKKP